MNKTIALFILAAMGFMGPLDAAEYAIDREHSAVTFKIRHLLSWTQGNFNEFEGRFTYDPEKPGVWKAEAVIQVPSLDTRNNQRDDHLRSADFFDAAKYPVMTFQSTGVREVTPSSAKLDGLLTLHGVQRAVTLDLVIHGVVQDPWGQTRSAFTATTTINRRDFGLTWSKTVETGQLLVGDEVLITLEIEGILQPPPSSAAD